MTINNKSERNYRGKCLGWPVTSYGGEHIDWSITYLTNSKQFLLGAKSGRRYIGGDTILGTTHTHNRYLQILYQYNNLTCTSTSFLSILSSVSKL